MREYETVSLSPSTKLALSLAVIVSAIVVFMVLRSLISQDDKRVPIRIGGTDEAPTLLFIIPYEGMNCEIVDIREFSKEQHRVNSR